MYSGVEGYVRESDGEDEVAELFHSLNGFEDLEPGDLLFDDSYSFGHMKCNTLFLN